jgi:hypothetical protein
MYQFKLVSAASMILRRRCNNKSFPTLAFSLFRLPTFLFYLNNLFFLLVLFSLILALISFYPLSLLLSFPFPIFLLSYSIFFHSFILSFINVYLEPLKPQFHFNRHIKFHLTKKYSLFTIISRHIQQGDRKARG